MRIDAGLEQCAALVIGEYGYGLLGVFGGASSSSG